MWEGDKGCVGGSLVYEKLIYCRRGKRCVGVVLVYEKLIDCGRGVKALWVEPWCTRS